MQQAVLLQNRLNLLPNLIHWQGVQTLSRPGLSCRAEDGKDVVVGGGRQGWVRGAI